GARWLVGVPLAHLAVGDGAAVRGRVDGLVRWLPGARPGSRERAPRRRGGVGPDLRGRGDRPDRRRANRAAVVAPPADPVRRAGGRRDRDLTAVAGHAAAAVGDLRDLVRVGSLHRGAVRGLYSHDGREDPGGQARAGVWL